MWYAVHFLVIAYASSRPNGPYYLDEEMYAVDVPSDDRLAEKTDAIRIELERNFSAEGNICALRAKDLGLLVNGDAMRLKRVVVRKAIRVVRFDGEPLGKFAPIGDRDELSYGSYIIEGDFLDRLLAEEPIIATIIE